MKNTTKLMVYFTVGIIVALILVPPIVQNIQVGQNFQNYATLQSLLMLPNLTELQAEINVWRNSIDEWVSSTDSFIADQLVANANNTAYITILLGFRDFITNWCDTVNSQLTSITSWQSFIDTVVNTLNDWYTSVFSYVEQLPEIIDNITELIQWRINIDAFVVSCVDQLSNLDSRITALENMMNSLSNYLTVRYSDVYLYTNGTHYIVVTPSNTYISETFSGIVPYMTGKTVFIASGTYSSDAVSISNTVLKGNSRNSVILNINGQLTLSNVSISGVTLNLTGSPIFSVYGQNNRISDCTVYPTGSILVDNGSLTGCDIYSSEVTQTIIAMQYFTIANNKIEFGKDAYGTCAITVISGTNIDYAWIENNLLYCTVSSNYPVGIWLQPASVKNLIISNNIITGVNKGIYVYSSSALNSIITGNVFYGTGTGTGLDLKNSHNTTIVGNIIRSFGTAININNPCQRLTIRDNHIFQCPTYINDGNTYDGTFFCDVVISQFSGQIVSVTLDTSRVYVRYTAKYVNVHIGSTSTTIYIDEVSLGSFTSQEFCFILNVGHSIRLNQTTGVSWQWICV